MIWTRPLSRSATLAASVMRNLRSSHHLQHPDFMRFMHASATVQFPVNRRKRSSNIPVKHDDETQEGSKETKKMYRVTDPDEFAAKSRDLIDKLIKALRPLEKINDPFFLTLGVDQEMGQYILIDLGPVHGQYTIQIDMHQQLLLFISPISGQIIYNVKNTGEWYSDEDGHNFEGLLVRDLIRHIQGVPDL